MRTQKAKPQPRLPRAGNGVKVPALFVAGRGCTSKPCGRCDHGVFLRKTKSLRAERVIAVIEMFPSADHRLYRKGRDALDLMNVFMLEYALRC